MSGGTPGTMGRPSESNLTLMRPSAISAMIFHHISFSAHKSHVGALSSSVCNVSCPQPWHGDSGMGPVYDWASEMISPEAILALANCATPCSASLNTADRSSVFREMLICVTDSAILLLSFAGFTPVFESHANVIAWSKVKCGLISKPDHYHGAVVAQLDHWPAPIDPVVLK